MNPAVIILARMKKIIRKFYKHNALTRETAKTKDEMRIRSFMIFKKLIANGIVVSAGNDKYYLDEVTNERHFKAVRKLFFVVLVIIVIAVIVWNFCCR